MKKASIIILTVAILGFLAYTNNQLTPHLVAGPISNSASSSGSSGSPASSNLTSPAQNQTLGYKDGTFTGSAVDSPYGTVQMSLVVASGKITDVNFLQMPSDMGHSAMLSRMSAPLLKQTTINSQSANIDFVSGATSTSEAYQQSLQSALDQAKI